MKVLATYNIKGGVGKTAAAVNLSCVAAKNGARTLVWDLDPQGAATFYFRVKPKIKGGTKKLLKKDSDLSARLKATDFPHLDLLPADFSYRHMDIVLGEAKKPWKRLRDLLAPLGSEYDFIILDCPPSVSLLSEAVFGAADALIVPVIPTTLSLRTYEQIVAFREDNGFERVKVLPFFSMADRRKKMHREIMESFPRERPEALKTLIPYASDVEQMGLHREPLVSYAPKSPSALAYKALWKEIVSRLDS